MDQKIKESNEDFVISFALMDFCSVKPPLSRIALARQPQKLLNAFFGIIFAGNTLQVL